MRKESARLHKPDRRRRRDAARRQRRRHLAPDFGAYRLNLRNLFDMQLMNFGKLLNRSLPVPGGSTWREGVTHLSSHIHDLASDSGAGKSWDSTSMNGVAVMPRVSRSRDESGLPVTSRIATVMNKTVLSREFKSFPRLQQRILAETGVLFSKKRTGPGSNGIAYEVVGPWSRSIEALCAIRRGRDFLKFRALSPVVKLPLNIVRDQYLNRKQLPERELSRCKILQRDSPESLFCGSVLRCSALVVQRPPSSLTRSLTQFIELDQIKRGNNLRDVC